MENKDIATIPYFTHEKDMERLDRTSKRLWVIILVLIFSLIASNGAWIYYESGFQDIETTIDATQDGNGINIVGGGDIDYGTESTNND